MPPQTQAPPVGPFALGGVVTTDYGVPNAINGSAHTGVDIGGLPIGTAIPAFVGGVVSRIWRDAAGGNQVSVTTPQGFTQTYAHLQAVNVSPNQQVSGSDIIGFLGNTGTTTGPHLHYEVQQPTGVTGNFTSSIDPAAFLSEFFTSTPPSPSGSGSGARMGNGPRPRSLSPASADACAMVPAETIKTVQDYIGPAGVLNWLHSTGSSGAAGQIKEAFPNVPLACLQQIAYGVAAKANPQDDFFGKASQALTDLLNPTLWKRTGLTLVGVSLIGIGILLYTKTFTTASIRLS